MFPDITVNIPAYNEGQRIGGIIKDLMPFFQNVQVINDFSTDSTVEAASSLGAKVVQNKFQKGYLGATKTGFRNVKTSWILTCDADGEHRVEDIIGIANFAIGEKFDLVLGTRVWKQISRPSEILLSAVASIKSPVFDTGTGLRMIKTSIARKMELKSKCVCGTFVLEVMQYEAAVGSYPILLHTVKKPRGIAWQHIPQFFILMRRILWK